MANIIGVCSWSLRASDVHELVAKVRDTGLSTIQIALTPILDGDWNARDTISALGRAGIALASGMMQTRGEDYSTLETIRRTGGIGPDEHWPENLASAKGVAALASALDIRLVTFHAGFLPEDPRDSRRGVMLDRVRRIADCFHSHDITLGLETGQESASTLRSLLVELAHPSLTVNFDPANMILYGMGDPVDALRDLADHVAQVHVKDALPAATRGAWGAETPAGDGAVDWNGLFEVVHRRLPDVPLIIERESGDDRVGDIRRAHRLCLTHAGATRA